MEPSRTDSPHMSTKDSTTKMATVANIPQPKANFLSLPGEIRNIIYRMVLTTQYAYDPVRKRFGRLETTLLHVNRKVRTESTAILHGANIWIFACICASKADHTSLKNDVPLTPQRSPGFLDMWPPALMIKLEVGNEINNGQTPLKIRYILARESIRLFVRWLWTVTSKNWITAERRLVSPIKGSHLTLVLFKSLFHSRTQLQEICLEPFALIGTLESIGIKGDIDPAVQQQLLKRMKSLFISAKSAIEIGNNHLQRGDNARRCGGHLEACVMFGHGWSFVHHAQYFLKNSSAGTFHPGDLRILWDLSLVLGSRYVREMINIGQFKIARRIAANMLFIRDLTSVDRLNLTLCKGCAQRGLCEGTDDSDRDRAQRGLYEDTDDSDRDRAQRGLYEDTDDSDRDCPYPRWLVDERECREIISILGQMPRACIRTYFETFPSTVKGLEASWMKVEPVHGLALGGDIHVGFGKIHKAIRQAQDELLQCSRRYR